MAAAAAPIKILEGSEDHITFLVQGKQVIRISGIPWETFAIESGIDDQEIFINLINQRSTV